MRDSIHSSGGSAMFSGSITTMGKIESVIPIEKGYGSGVRLKVAAGDLDLADVGLGDSISINGACMTVVSKTDTEFAVDVSHESLNRTAGLAHTGDVNLEKASMLAARIGAHLVSGHVDGVGSVIAVNDAPDGRVLTIQTTAELLKFLILRPVIVVNGLSLFVSAPLTAEAPKHDSFEFNTTVPTALMAGTTLGKIAKGDHVNLEIDMVARYMERILSLRD